ncbi:FadR/GntR family transcriptional regulator [Cryptosporangium phraense]|uniref:FadR family transcriptional regulator n=1 Tax=Cryptosporangium phraense TaxID=2593070 RepID=A0A545ARW2_9ACTN|nr:FadR/GntR family transcriptional regulator [Cryptosporangium phraense]TQS44076.1 FadR family transcriptional regulator [Cryptosporangium phraense]
MSLTDDAIARIRGLIQSGELVPGSRLPPENQLAAELGISRNSMREAVKALQFARVLDARPGDGTYVTSLAPGLLLAGLGSAVDLLRDDTLLEVMEIRSMLEPAATSVAALRITPDGLAELEFLLGRMRAAAADAEELVRYDMDFHRTVVAATGNQSLTSVLDGLSGRTARARVWRGLLMADASATTLAEHQAIYDALASGDPELARAAALLHVSSSARWLRHALEESGGGRR